MKIAIVDTGIDPKHPFLRDDSLQPPPSYPRGQLQYTSSKVIVARVMSDRRLLWPTAVDDVGHGTHLAGIAAGAASFKAPNGQMISGVAPKAFLMNYKVIYEHGGDGAFGTDESVIAGIEAAVRDGADVINLSLGGLAVTDPTLDALAQAAEGAFAAGVVVVAAAGNRGADASTVSSPGTAANVITVGAVSAGGLIVVPVRVTGPGTPPADLANVDSIPFLGPPKPSAPVGPTSFVPTELNGTPLPGTSLYRAIALIRRGEFLFTDKIKNAAVAGAVGVVIWNNNPDQEPFGGFAPNTTIPAVMVSNEAGRKLVAWYNANPDAARMQIGYPGGPRGDVLGDFSSRGPAADYNLKPDVSAPGLDIYSSELEGRFDAFSGTSMAVPHVAGAAALLKQRHPSWTPRPIKAALVATAKPVTNLSRTKRYGLMDAGAGRIDVAAASQVKALVDPPKMSFGRQTLATAGRLALSQTFRLRDVSGEGGTYALAGRVVEGRPGLSVQVTPDRLTLKPSGEATFTVRLTVGDDAQPGDYDAEVLVDGPSRIRVPLWARVQPGVPVRSKSLLLVDELGMFKLPDGGGHGRGVGGDVGAGAWPGVVPGHQRLHRLGQPALGGGAA
ncbi:MAG: S8 family serine peptidase [Chloroflexi bacterium]|nr:S8 family serine peptidase [Chloroflexota bacterium]